MCVPRATPAAWRSVVRQSVPRVREPAGRRVLWWLRAWAARSRGRGWQVEASGWVFDLRRFSVHDGPGIRTAVFLKGCPLHCGWCHNPESQRPDPQLLVREHRCLHCGACIAACPHGALRWQDDRVATDPVLCQLCGACADACPAEAREVVGRRMGVSEVLREIERDRPFFDASGGGMTVSGGEPLAQPDFTRALLTACREHELHTVLDTSGHAPTEVAMEVAGLADLVLFDLKHPDDDRHREGTGVGNALILHNLRRLLAAGVDVLVRIPLVPGYNDRAIDLERAAALVASLEPVPPVELLPFHPAAEEKHRRFGLSYRHAGARTQERAALDAFREHFSQAGVTAIVGG